MQLQYKYFGLRSGLRVSEFALGTGNFGERLPGGIPADEVQKILTAYVDAGGNLLATAEAYQLGQAEEHVGEFIATRRGDFVVASKYSRGLGAHPLSPAVGNHRRAMVQAVEGSLRRLRTDYIDIYLAHFDDGITPLEEIMRGFEDLVHAGKILYPGLSNFPSWRIAYATAIADVRGWARLAAIEVEYSLLERTSEREQIPMARELGLGVMTYSPLANGLLSGKYRQGQTGGLTSRGRMAAVGATNEDAVLDALISVAAEMKIETSQVAIGWLKAKGVFPILGARTAAQLKTNLAAINCEIPSRCAAQLDEASAIALGYPHALLQHYRSSIADAAAS